MRDRLQRQAKHCSVCDAGATIEMWSKDVIHYSFLGSNGYRMTFGGEDIAFKIVHGSPQSREHLIDS